MHVSWSVFVFFSLNVDISVQLHYHLFCVDIACVYVRSLDWVFLFVSECLYEHSTVLLLILCVYVRLLICVRLSHPLWISVSVCSSFITHSMCTCTSPDPCLSLFQNICICVQLYCCSFCVYMYIYCFSLFFSKCLSVFAFIMTHCTCICTCLDQCFSSFCIIVSMSSYKITHCMFIWMPLDPCVFPSLFLSECLLYCHPLNRYMYASWSAFLPLYLNVSIHVRLYNFTHCTCLCMSSDTSVFLSFVSRCLYQCPAILSLVSVYVCLLICVSDSFSLNVYLCLCMCVWLSPKVCFSLSLNVWISVRLYYHSLYVYMYHTIVQELCESWGGCPGLSVLMSLPVSVDVKLYWTMLWHWSQLVPNMSTDIWGH